MNDQEVRRQVTQMVEFIKQEAKEKANEIMVSAEEDFNIEKLQVVEAEKAKIRKEFERKESQVDVKKKIEYSTQLNAQRLKVLQARNDAVQTIYEVAKERLGNISRNPMEYKGILAALIKQACDRLGEPSVMLKCREADLELVKEAAKEAKMRIGASAPVMNIDIKHFLSPPPAPGLHDVCYGGVVVTTADGKIVCNNTLEERLRLAFTKNLPTVRTMVFGPKLSSGKAERSNHGHH